MLTEIPVDQEEQLVSQDEPTQKEKDAEILKNITEVGLSQIKVFHMVGFFQIGVMLRDLINQKPAEEISKIERSIPIFLHNDVVEKIEIFSKAAKINRQQLLRNIVHVGIDQLDLLFKTGFVPTVMAFEKVGDAIKDLISDGEKAHNFIKDGKIISK